MTHFLKLESYQLVRETSRSDSYLHSGVLSSDDHGEQPEDGHGEDTHEADRVLGKIH